MITVHPSSAGPSPVTYLFVDGGHLRERYAEFSKTWFGQETDFAIEPVKAHFGAFRCFYYDCLDETKKDNETDDQFRARVQKQQTFFDRIESCDATHVRYGSVTGKRRRQKEVDILLAVNALNHAVRRNMDRVVILTGDQDFKPVVESLVDMGVYVKVAGDRKHTSRELAKAADSYEPLCHVQYHEFAPVDFNNRFPLPNFHLGLISGGRTNIIAKGTASGTDVIICRAGATVQAFVECNGKARYSDSFPNLDRMKLYLSLEFGDITWTS